MSDIAVIQYESLRQYLASYLHTQRSVPGGQNSRASAREKLTRLTRQHFSELVIDVYDEMNRRQKNSPDVPFLPVKDDFHPKRNQGRQKLATFPVQRFKDLASDVYSELERRNPHVIKSYLSKYGESDGTYPANDELQRANILRAPPQQQHDSRKPSIHNTGRGYGSPTQSQNFGSISNSNNHGFGNSNSSMNNISNNNNNGNLDNLLQDLGSMMSNNDKLRNQQQSLARDDAYMLKTECENRVRKLEEELNYLAADKDELKADNNALKNDIRALEEDLDRQKNINQDMNTEIETLNVEYSRLKEDFDAISEEHESQQQIVKDIRAEATNLLDEIKQLTQKNEDLKNVNKHLENDIDTLRRELEQATKAQVAMAAAAPKGSGVPWGASSSPTGSNAPPLQRTDTERDMRPNTSDLLPSQNVIPHHMIEDYENAIHDLMRAARSDTPTSVLVAMKSVVLACKTITEEIERHENTTHYTQNEDILNELKSQLSNSLTSVMGAAKKHATSNGKAPLHELEDSSRSLTNIVYDLIDTCGSFKGDANGGSFHDAMEIEDLKRYLEEQTDQIVQAIQNLLHAMRQSSQSGFGSDFQDTVDSITTIVQNLVGVSQKTLAHPSYSHYQETGVAILNDLSMANEQLSRLGNQMTNSTTAVSKNAKQKLASSSYEIAKFVKELISLLDS